MAIAAMAIGDRRQWRHHLLSLVVEASAKRYNANNSGEAVARALTRLHQALAIGLLGLSSAAAAMPSDLMQLLESGDCPGCELERVDLVHGQLQGANLKEANLRDGNLSRADLRRADLRNANLEFTSLQGANLQGSDLRGARLYGTDLRGADLRGAKLDANQLASSHSEGAEGIPPTALDYASIHNEGVRLAKSGRHPDAEKQFSQAINKRPEAAISWLARGITRQEQGRNQEAAADLSYAAKLYKDAGADGLSKQLKEASEALKKGKPTVKGNGLGSKAIGGAWKLMQTMAPMALKLVAPMF